VNSRPVHAVVVAYHAADLLARCLAGLDRQVPVTVVDNSSSAEVAEVAGFHGATYFDSGTNRGFAAGVNLALARLSATDEDVLLLNPDAVVTPLAVCELSRFLHSSQNSRAAAVAPCLLGLGGEVERVTWPFPTPGRMWAEALGLGGCLPVSQTYVVGTVLLLRREAIDDVGPFDERFFLYAEETDWQRRARLRGWTSAVCMTARAEHVGAGTSTDKRRRERLFHAAQETYIRKWYGGEGWCVYRIAACLGATARALLLTRDRRREAARRMLLYLRGPRRCAALGSE
jgi:GT2 family glycosyltransferase